MLSAFISPILTAIRWLAITALPFMLSSFVFGLLVKIGVSITSMYVIVWAAEWLRDYAVGQLATIGAGETGAAVLQMLSMFGVLEGLSLIVSCYLAKATWLSIRPSLTWLTTPGQ